MTRQDGQDSVVEGNDGPEMLAIFEELRRETGVAKASQPVPLNRDQEEHEEGDVRQDAEPPHLLPHLHQELAARVLFAIQMPAQIQRYGRIPVKGRDEQLLDVRDRHLFEHVRKRMAARGAATLYVCLVGIFE